MDYNDPAPSTSAGEPSRQKEKRESIDIVLFDDMVSSTTDDLYECEQNQEEEIDEEEEGGTEEMEEEVEEEEREYSREEMMHLQKIIRTIYPKYSKIMLKKDGVRKRGKIYKHYYRELLEATLEAGLTENALLEQLAIFEEAISARLKMQTDLRRQASSGGSTTCYYTDNNTLFCFENQADGENSD